jgi:hypothetical protein
LPAPSFHHRHRHTTKPIFWGQKCTHKNVEIPNTKFYIHLTFRPSNEKGQLT